MKDATYEIPSAVEICFEDTSALSDRSWWSSMQRINGLHETYQYPSEAWTVGKHLPESSMTAGEYGC